MENFDCIPIRRALISVSDKTGLVDLARVLTDQNVEILSTGGTASFLREQGIPVRDVQDVTGFPEMMDGRIKTLHPRIHGGLLGRRDNTAHMRAMDEQKIPTIDLLVVNLYPFEEVAKKPGVTRETLIENIDIGGPAMLRSAAKNHDFVAVLCDPAQYGEFLQQFQLSRGSTRPYRQQLAMRVFARTAAYDEAILGALATEGVILRYGENPHQKARVRPNPRDELALATQKPLQGKELSFNNLLDADAAFFALRCLMDGRSDDQFGAIVIKHGTPCGAALGITLRDASERAIASDPTSAFGGIVALSHEVDGRTASSLSPIFLELVLAPSFSEDSLGIFSRKKDLRLLSLSNLLTSKLPEESCRSIAGGYLHQTHDYPFLGMRSARVVSNRTPSEHEWKALDLAFRLSIPTRSNAITLCSEHQLLAAGAGQTSRVDSVRIAINKAKQLNHQLSGCALGSDAFFPFADGIEEAASAGISAIAQPGGSKRDEDVIAAANAHDIAMVFTEERHFRH